MAVSNVKNRRYEDRDSGSRAPVLGIAAIALFGAAFLMLYLAFAAPQPGTGMEAIRDVMRGLGGSLYFLLPLVLAAGGAVCVLALRGRRPSYWRLAMDLLLVVTLFSAVHVFFAERIVRERMTINGFSNFVAKSYGYGAGGGAIGALLAWPLYHNLGVAGGFIGALLIALILMTLAGHTAAIVRKVRDWSDGRPEKLPARPAKNEHTFDEIETSRPARPARRRDDRDPFSESVMGGAQPRGGTRHVSRETRGSAQRRPQTDSPARRRSDTAYAGGAAHAEPARRSRKAAEPAKKGKKLYIENVKPAQPEPVRPADALFDVDGFEAEDIRAVKGNKGAFGADAPSFMDDAAPKKAAKEDAAPFDAPAPKAAKTTKAKNADAAETVVDDEIPDSLRIRPDEYEKPDEEFDDTPFDVPHTVEEDKPKAFAKLSRKAAEAEEPPEYSYPPIDLLAAGEIEDNTGHGQRDMQKAKLLEETLQSFGISTKLIGIAHGPAVTRFELQPAPGVKVSRITSLADDIALNLAAMSVRIEAPIPGKAAVGVEIPNDKIEMVRLRDVLESADARKHPSKIAVGLGKDNSGRYIVADIAKMPHVLIAGQTGSGKSVCINSIIASILFRATPEEVKLILIDPKVVELSMYNDIPHLVCPVVTDPKKAASALDWAVAEMTMRYKKFAERGTKNIKGYNSLLKEGEPMMPQMVIIIDELADLMMVSPGEVEDSICRLAQLARAAGIHLVIATQRPSVNVITGIIKANIPTRIAFSVASQVDSRTMIDHGGAEKLLGNGDMLYVPPGISKPMRVQGAWVSEEEIHSIVSYIKESGEAEYDPDMIEHLENAVRTDAEKEEFAAEYDPRLPEAVDFVIETGQASISMLQRHMRIGYARAGRLIDEMAQRGIVSEANGAKPREVLITREQANDMFED